MDKEFLIMIIKLVCFFPFILLSIYLVLKYGGSKFSNMQNGKYIKIFERVQLSKDNSLLVVKIGQKGYVISNTSKGLEILMPVSKEELLEIEKSRNIPQYKDLKELYERVKKRKE